MSTLCIRDSSSSLDVATVARVHTSNQARAKMTRPSTKRPAMMPAMAPIPRLPSSVSVPSEVAVEGRLAPVDAADGVDTAAVAAVVAVVAEMPWLTWLMMSTWVMAMAV